MLTYNEFMSTVPKNTSRIITRVIPHIRYYMSDDNNVQIYNANTSVSGFKRKMVFLLLYWMSLEKPYNDFLGKYQFMGNLIRIEGHDSSLIELLYDDIVGFFPDYKDKTKYITMTPLDVLIPIFKDLSESSLEIFRKVFGNFPGYSQFLKDMEELNTNIKQEYNKRIEEKLYGNLSISIISFFETAANIRSILIENDAIPQKFLSTSNNDVTSLSLLIAVFFYNNDSSKEETSLKDAIIKYLESKGVSKGKLLNLVSFTYKASGENHVAAIQTEFIKYAKKGVNENRNESQVTVASILENVFDRQFTDSLIIEKILNELECKISDVQGFEAHVNDLRDELIKEESHNYIKDFYMNLSKEVKEFVDYAAKVYSLLLFKMKEKGYKSSYLTCEDDADTLAIFIAAYHFNGDVATFYKDHGIDLIKIYTLLGLSLTDKEIEETPVDERVLVDRFKRFVTGGVNSKKNTSKITVNDIIHNLCDRSFNKSMIMESIYTELTHDFDIAPNFLDQMLEYLEKKEKERKEIIRQNLFVDLTVSTIDYLESVAKIFAILRKGKYIKDWSDESLEPISLLLAALNSQDKKLSAFISGLGFDSFDHVCSQLGISIRDGDINNAKFDIDLLHDRFAHYIFGGVNKNKKRSSIDIYSIIKNAFNRDLNNDVNITKFLAAFNLSYDTFDYLDKLYRDFQDREKKKELDSEAENRLKGMFIFEGTPNGFLKRYFDRVFAIYTTIKNAVKGGKIDTDLINSTNDIIILSFLLGTKDTIDCDYMKKPFTSANIIRILGIDSDQVEKTKIDYVAMEKVFGTYLKSFVGSAKYDDDIMKILVSRDTGIDVIKRLCDKLGYDYDVLKVEIITGRPYDESLTVDDRIRLLSDEQIEVIDPDSVESILNFGSSLVPHSKYIHDTLPKLVLNDNLEQSTKKINEVLGKIYERRVSEKPRSLWKRFIGTEVQESSEVVINQDAVLELKDKIGDSVDVLKKELILYDEIKRYIEAYRQKNKEHYLAATKTVEEIKARLEKLDPSKEEEYSEYLSVSSALQIMQDKATRFATTNQLMQQELLRVSQAIVSHFMTINALEMARDDMLPLVGSELAIGQGIKTEKSALELSKGIIDLFQAMLSRNVEDTLSNIHQLQASTISRPVLDTINRDITTYLDHLKKMQATDSQVALALDSEDLKEDIEKPTELKL